MPLVRSREIMQAHDKAMTYILNWWEKNKGRALIPNVTGDPYGEDFYNDVEIIHINWRTECGKWNDGPFPYKSLRELTHKIVKYQRRTIEEKKEVYVIHVATDYSRFVISKINDFNAKKSHYAEMPAENKPEGKIKMKVCYSNIFEEYLLPKKIFDKQTFKHTFQSSNSPQTLITGLVKEVP